MQTPVVKKKMKMLPLLKQYRFVLTAGHWQKWFPEEKYKLLIAMALNDCVQNKDQVIGIMCIDGYLIDKKKIYLVWKIPAGCFYKVLDFFYWRVREYMTNELKINDQGTHREPGKPSAANWRDLETALFERMPLNNEWLVQLITGNKVELEYYSPKLARLKKLVHKESYCSAIDYEGGCGPVTLVPVKK